MDQARRWYEDDPNGHVWKERDGVVDIFAFEPSEFHNGPECVLCGYAFCHHCESGRPVPPCLDRDGA